MGRGDYLSRRHVEKHVVEEVRKRLEARPLKMTSPRSLNSYSKTSSSTELSKDRAGWVYSGNGTTKFLTTVGWQVSPY